MVAEASEMATTRLARIGDDYVLGGIGVASIDEETGAVSDPTGLAETLRHLAPGVLSALRFTVLMQAEGNVPMALWPVDTHAIP